VGGRTIRVSVAEARKSLLSSHFVCLKLALQLHRHDEMGLARQWRMMQDNGVGQLPYPLEQKHSLCQVVNRPCPCPLSRDQNAIGPLQEERDSHLQLHHLLQVVCGRRARDRGGRGNSGRGSSRLA